MDNSKSPTRSPAAVAACGHKQDQIRVLIVSVLFLATYFAAAVLPRALELPKIANVTLAIIPAIVFGYFILTEVRIIRTMDEMQQRIQLEALAVAYPASILLVMALGLLERVIELPKGDWSYRHIWPIMSFFYFLGLAIARRRYQ